MLPEWMRIQKNSTLAEMLYGMLWYGVAGQLVILLWINGNGFSLGWWIGVLVAVGCSCQMWWSLDRAMRLPEAAAAKKLVGHSLLRYGFIVLTMAVVFFTEIAHPLAAVFGVFALKAGAYLQPLMHKLLDDRR